MKGGGKKNEKNLREEKKKDTWLVYEKSEKDGLGSYVTSRHGIIDSKHPLSGRY